MALGNHSEFHGIIYRTAVKRILGEDTFTAVWRDVCCINDSLTNISVAERNAKLVKVQTVGTGKARASADHGMEGPTHRTGAWSKTNVFPTKCLFSHLILFPQTLCWEDTIYLWHPSSPFPTFPSRIVTPWFCSICFLLSSIKFAFVWFTLETLIFWRKGRCFTYFSLWVPCHHKHAIVSS